MNYITLFDKTYLPHGLALIESMYRHCQPFTLHVLALDDETMRAVENVDCVRVVKAGGDQWDKIKGNRTWKEACWTAEPLWVQSMLNAVSELVYIDSDCYFFSSPHRHLLRIKPHHELGLTPHNFPDERRNRAKGRYNFGFAYFRSTDRVKSLVSEWASAAIEHCDETACGHQKQLDSWPEIMGDALFEFDRSVNVGPWQQASISGSPPMLEGEYLVNFHFHEFRRGDGPNFIYIGDEVWNQTHYNIPRDTQWSVYDPYRKALEFYL